MNINDYTYHICDRFVLIFIAFVGLIGTSYIIVSGNLSSSTPSLSGFSPEFNITLQNNAINHGLKSQFTKEFSTDLTIPESSMQNSTEGVEIESASASIGE